MGKVIAFWSAWHGRGNTSNCIASAMQFSMVNNNSSMIAHTQYIRSGMEQVFLTGKEDDDILKFSDFGLDSLERALRTGKLEPKNFDDYTSNVIKKKLEFLPGSKKTNVKIFESSIGQTIIDIINFAKESKEFSFVDVGSAINDDMTKRVLDMSDLIFVTVDQSKFVLKDFFEKQYKLLEDKNIVLLVGRYDLDSNYSIKDIKKEFKYDGEIIGIPYVTDYSDALNSHSIKKFFEKYYLLKDEPFFDSLNYINELILDNVK